MLLQGPVENDAQFLRMPVSHQKQALANQDPQVQKWSGGLLSPQGLAEWLEGPTADCPLA